MTRLEFFERVTRYGNENYEHRINCVAESEGQECCLVKGHVLEFLWEQAVLHARQAIEDDDPFGVKHVKMMSELKAGDPDAQTAEVIR